MYRRKKSDSKKSGGNKSSSKRSTLTQGDLTAQITGDDSHDSSSTTTTSSNIRICHWKDIFDCVEENGKRAKKRPRTDSVEKLKTFENKVVIEVKLPEEIKTCLSHDWHLINNENKVNDYFSSVLITFFHILVVNSTHSTYGR